MKQLVLGPIPDNFTPEKHIVASPASFLDREFIYPQFEDLNYVKIINDRESRKQFDILTTQTALFLVNKVAVKYNPHSFSKFPFRSWKIIYFPSLGAITAWLYRKRLLALKLIEKYKDEKLNVQLVEGDFQLSINNEVDLINNVLRDPIINAWILSKFVKKYMPETWAYTSSKIVFHDNSDTPRLENNVQFKKQLYSFLRGLFFRSDGIYGFSRFDTFIFHLILSFKRPISNYFNYDEVLKEHIIEWDEEISDIYDLLIPSSLKDILNQKSKRRYSKGKLINYSNRLYYNECSKLDAALAVSNKEIIIATQHGGHNYGSAYTFEYGKEIEQKADLFISWGSYLVDSKINTLVLPSPLLSKYLNIHSIEKKTLLMVGTDMKAFQNRFDSVPEDTGYLEYRKNKIIFLSSLQNKGLIEDVLYRPYPFKQSSFLDKDFILSKIPRLRIHEGNLHNDLQSCMLLILDHPGTTWNIAMAMNTPTICFWDRNHFPFNNFAENFLNKFESLGVYFDSPQAAADKVNSLISEGFNIQVWWNSSEIQNLRKDWMDAFAMADKNWRFKWIKKLWALK